MCRAVYVRAEVPDSVLLRAKAQALLLDEEAVFSHETAAVILGSPVGAEPTHRLRVTLPPTAAGGAGAGLRRCRRLLGPDDVVRVGGVQTTSPARTLLDLAAEPDREEALVAVDALAHLWHHALPAAREQVRHLRGLRRLRQVREVLDAAEPLTESPMETRLRLLLVDRGLPRPVAQHPVHGASGRLTARLDLAYPELLVGIEYDGRDAHPVGLARDRERAWQLHRAGWLVVHVTAELYADRDRLVGRVQEARDTQASRLRHAALD